MWLAFDLAFALGLLAAIRSAFFVLAFNFALSCFAAGPPIISLMCAQHGDDAPNFTCALPHDGARNHITFIIKAASANWLC